MIWERDVFIATLAAFNNGDYDKLYHDYDPAIWPAPSEESLS